MKLSITSRGNTKPPIPKESRKKKVRKNDRNAKVNLKEPMAVNIVVVKVPGKGAKANEKRLEGWKKTK